MTTMDGIEIVRAVEQLGGYLWADGEFVAVRFPKKATDRAILDQIRDRKIEVLEVLRERPFIRGARVTRWNPVEYPVQIERWATVTDARKFAESSLRQIEALLTGGTWESGNWTLPELLRRLEMVGVSVEIENRNRLVQ